MLPAPPVETAARVETHRTWLWRTRDGRLLTVVRARPTRTVDAE
jgi:hypothetical protein